VCAFSTGHINLRSAAFLSMTNEQIILFTIMGSVLALLVWGRIRYDLVAFSALATGRHCRRGGQGHRLCRLRPSGCHVIIALVLIVSRALSQSGAVDLLTRNIISAQRGIKAHIAIMGSWSVAHCRPS
jgi:hypothetical protein